MGAAVLQTFDADTDASGADADNANATGADDANGADAETADANGRHTEPDHLQMAVGAA